MKRKCYRLMSPTFIRIFLWFFPLVLLVQPGPAEVNLAGAPEGLIIPFREQTLGGVVLGKIDRVNVREGDPVEADAVLIELEDALQRLEVERRRLAMDRSAALNFARNRVAVLKEELESTRKLYDQSRSVSQEEINRKQLDYAMAVSELKQLEQDVGLAEIEYQMAQEELEQRRIRAPHAGVVTEVQVEAGEIARPGQPMVSLVSVRQCYLQCHLDPRRAETLEVGQKVQVVVPLATEKVILEGKIDLIAPTVDAASGLRQVRVLFDNPERRVAPGMSAFVILNPNSG